MAYPQQPQGVQQGGHMPGLDATCAHVGHLVHGHIDECLPLERVDLGIGQPALMRLGQAAQLQLVATRLQALEAVQVTGSGAVQGFLLGWRGLGIGQGIGQRQGLELAQIRGPDSAAVLRQFALGQPQLVGLLV